MIFRDHINLAVIFHFISEGFVYFNCLDFQLIAAKIQVPTLSFVVFFCFFFFVLFCFVFFVVFFGGGGVVRGAHPAGFHFPTFAII